jgi:mitochondrial protein import protein ZIM17
MLNYLTSQPMRTRQLSQIQFPSSSRSISRSSISFLRSFPRYNSSSASTLPPFTDQASSPENDALRAEQNAVRREQESVYQITFTCKPCGHRSSHRISKHGYHKGTVLIRCPSCSNRHVMSDHLQIFMDEKSTLGDILRRDGRTLTKGYLEGDMEIWEDGTIHEAGNAEPFVEATSK